MLFFWLNGMLRLNVMKKSPWTTDGWMAGVHSARDKHRLRDTSGHFKTIESYNFQYHWYGLSSRNSTIFIIARYLFYWTSWFIRPNI